MLSSYDKMYGHKRTLVYNVSLLEKMLQIKTNRGTSINCTMPTTSLLIIFRPGPFKESVKEEI